MISKLYDEILKEAKIGKLAKGSLQAELEKSVNQYKEKAKKHGFTTKNIKHERQTDVRVITEILTKTYNEMVSRIIKYLTEYVQDKKANRPVEMRNRTLETRFGHLHKFWHDVDQINIKNAALAHGHAHAPTRVSIYNKIREFNEYVPEIKETETGQPIYYFHLLPIYAIKDVIESKGYRKKIDDDELKDVYAILSDEFNLSKDQLVYLNATKEDVDRAKLELARKSEERGMVRHPELEGGPEEKPELIVKTERRR